MLIPIESYLSFFAASVVLALAPGPDNIFVLTQSAMHGRRAGLLVTLGLCTGLLAHTAAVVLGVAAIFQASALAFTALKFAGAAYLLYLAWGAWHATASPIEARNGAGLEGWALFRRGIIMNVTNPKVSIFFLAFLPQFADPKRGSLALQLVTLGAGFLVATLLVFGAVALLAGSIGRWLAGSRRAQVVINRSAALIFAALALRLATAQR
jgi:threonine/homoserine/homoserine lactone efflux protein